MAGEADREEDMRPRGNSRRPKQSLEALRLIIKELLSDHAVVYQGGDSFINFEELGPRESGGLPLNAAYIRRYFQNHPEEMRSISRYFADKDEADSHLLLEIKLWEMRLHNPTLASPVDHIHFRSTAGHKDAEWALNVAKNKAKKGNWEAWNQIWNYNRAIDVLAQWFHTNNVELYATFVRRKAIRDADKLDEKKKEYYERFLELTDKEYGEGKSIGDAYLNLERESGVSRRRLEQIIADMRVAYGGIPRKRGRPAREEEGAVVTKEREEGE